MATLYDRGNITFDQYKRYYQFINLGVFDRLPFEETDDEYYTLDICHTGTPHEGQTPHSGRYPWGSGEHSFQRPKNLWEWAERNKKRDPNLTDDDLALVAGFRTGSDFRKAVDFDHYVKKDMSGFCAYVDKLRSEGHTDEEICDLCSIRNPEALNNTYNYSKAVWSVVKPGYKVNSEFHDQLTKLEEMGYTESQIAIGLGITATRGGFLESDTNRFKNIKSIARHSDMLDILQKNQELIDQGITNRSERARMLGFTNESTLRSIENGARYNNAMVLFNTAEELKKQIDAGGYLDVGKGTAQRLGIKDSQLDKALEILRQDGYDVVPTQIQQFGASPDHKTTTMVLVPPGTTYMDVKNDLKVDGSKLKVVNSQSEDGGETFHSLVEEPIMIDPKRIYVRYKENGGEERDGLIELRRGVEDISLGNAAYAQVRIGVQGDLYLKGMAVMQDPDKIPEGYDIIFNSNKKEGTPINEVFKEIDRNKHSDPANPFGAAIALDDESLLKARRHYIDPETGETKLSAVNIVNEEGDWAAWSKTLPSQFLSKQRPEFIQQQLDKAYDKRKAELDEINTLTNPLVRKELLMEYANSQDKATSTLKAAPVSGQTTRVILPFPELKDNEVYAPGYEDGTWVALVRYPHEGIFEIPKLKVNNKVKDCKNILGQCYDACGINHNTANILSGADFDGDSVVMLPLVDKTGKKLNNIITSADIDMKPYESLRDFNTKDYQLPKEVRDTAKTKNPDKRLIVSDTQRGTEMGKATNLLMDITLAGASGDELCNATKYAMVVIDAKKHGLDWKQAYEDFGIKELKEKYRGNGSAGASTLITKSTSEEHVPYFNYTTDKSKMTTEQLEAYNNGENIRNYKEKLVSKPDKKDKETGKVLSWKQEQATKTSNKMIEAFASGGNAFDLIDPSRVTTQEVIYANYANKVHDLGNAARKEYRETKTYKVDKEAAKLYAPEVESLSKKVDAAIASKPLTRQVDSLATSYASMKMKQEREDSGAELDSERKKKIKREAKERALRQMGVDKNKGVAVTVDITDREWEAIQAHAISTNKLQNIINNTDKNRLKELAMPREKVTLSAAQKTLIESKLAKGAALADIANDLGISVSSIYNNVDVSAIRHSVIFNYEYIG